MNAKRQKPSAHRVREISVESLCSPQTVVRFFEGRPVHNVTRIRIERAIEALRLGAKLRRESE